MRVPSVGVEWQGAQDPPQVWREPLVTAKGEGLQGWRPFPGKSAVISTPKDKGPSGDGGICVPGPRPPTPALEEPRGNGAGTAGTGSVCGAAAAATRPSPALQAYATVTLKPSSPARLLKVGAVVLISGAVLLLFGAIGAFYFWKGNDNHVSPKSGSQGYLTTVGVQGPPGAWGGRSP